MFDTSTGSLRFPPLTVDGAVWSAAFTPDAAELALAIGEEARLLVVDSATGAERASAPGVTVPPLGGEVRAGAAGRRRRTHPAPARRRRSPVTSCCSAQPTARCGRSTPRRSNCADDRAGAGHAGVDPSARRRDAAHRRPARHHARRSRRTGRVLWQHDQGLADIGDGASGATCAHLAVIEQQGTFYCANAYGRLAEHDLGSGYAIRVLDAQNGNSGPLWPAGDGTELVSFGDNEAVVSRWRLDGSGPITHLVAPGFRGWSFNPSGDRLLVEQGGAFDGYPSQVIDVASGDVVRTLDGLINADWLDDDTVIGALINDDGQVETAHIDLPDGDLVADGFVVDPIPDGAYLASGKERMLVVYRERDRTRR